ncbi:YesL family protein [Schleiferilactobacillus shenzhenensis]|nr:YesL family protein [Schleiferilactobacillus shenzhenensis]
MMARFFALDGKAYRTLQSMYQLLVLNLMFVIGCLPVVTIGASLSALYGMALKLDDPSTVQVAPGFWHAYRKNLVQGSVLGWLVMGLVAGMIAFYWWIGKVVGPSSPLMVAVIALYAILFLTVMYIFPLVGRYQETIGQVLHNAVTLAIGNAWESVVMFLLMIAVVFYLPFKYHWIAIIVLVMGFAGTAYLQSWLLQRVFAKYE